MGYKTYNILAVIRGTASLMPYYLGSCKAFYLIFYENSKMLDKRLSNMKGAR